MCVRMCSCMGIRVHIHVQTRDKPCSVVAHIIHTHTYMQTNNLCPNVHVRLAHLEGGHAYIQIHTHTSICRLLSDISTHIYMYTYMHTLCRYDWRIWQEAVCIFKDRLRLHGFPESDIYSVRADKSSDSGRRGKGRGGGHRGPGDGSRGHGPSQKGGRAPSRARGNSRQTDKKPAGKSDGRFESESSRHPQEL